MSDNFNQHDELIKKRMEFLAAIDVMTPERLRQIASIREHDEDDIRFVIHTAHELNEIDK